MTAGTAKTGGGLMDGRMRKENLRLLQLELLDPAETENLRLVQLELLGLLQLELNPNLSWHLMTKKSCGCI